jgi:hypothetical protein
MAYNPLIGRAEYENALRDLVDKKHDKLYPNSPIEITIDFTDRDNRHSKDTERSWHFTFFAEGQWIANELTIEGARSRITETIKVNQECWATPRCYINPEWEKWCGVRMADLYRLLGLSA